MGSVVIARALHNTCNIFWITWIIVNFLSVLKICLSVSLHFFLPTVIFFMSSVETWILVTMNLMSTACLLALSSIVSLYLSLL